MKLYDWDGLCIQVVVFCTRTDVVFAQDGGRDRKGKGWYGRGVRGNVKKFNVSIGGSCFTVFSPSVLAKCCCCAFRLKKGKKETPSNTHNNELHGQILGRRERRT